MKRTGLKSWPSLVSDLLYAGDYARGFDWALELIQPETRKALGVG